jgi:hypothetical protein
MDAEMASQALVENNPAAFGGKLIDDIDDATRSEIYGAVLRVVQSDLAKTLQLKRLSRPTKTLEGIKKTGTINISDPNVADEFSRFMKESDPKGHKKIEQTVDLMNLDPKGKKGHAYGGRVPLAGGKLAQTLIQQIIKKYKGRIDDKLLQQMLVDDNPQRLAEVMATVDEALLMQGKGMGPETIMQTMRESWKRKKNATGGRVPFVKGKIAKYATPEGLAALIEKLFPGTTKLGKTSKPLAEKTQLKQAIAAFQERTAPKIWENPDKVRAAVDDIFSTGDYKYDAEMAAEALVENNPKAFGGKLLDDLDDATRMDIYGAVLRVVQSDLAKTLQLKKLSRPTKTLEGIKKTGKINISDPNVADEFTRFMKEADPVGHAKIQKVVDDANQQLELQRFKTKGRKKNASGGRVSLSAGGLAGILGE